MRTHASRAASADPPERSVTVVAQHVGPVGGMERQLTEVIAGLLEGGWEVVVIARACELKPHANLRFVRVRGPYRPAVVGFPWFFLASGALLRRHARGIVHVNGAITTRAADVVTVHFCHLALHRLGVPRRGSRDSPLFNLNSRVTARLTRTAERWCYRPSRVGCLVGISAGVGREIAGTFPALAGRVRVIPYGVDRDRFRPNSATRRVVRAELLGEDHEDLLAVFVGGDWHRKGLGEAIGSLAGAPGWRLVVVGAGDQPHYETLAQRLGVGDRVQFAGQRVDTERYYAGADAFLLPTAYETFSLVTHEAAACGLPLLVCRVHGVEDLLEDGRSGWFVHRDPTDIATRLRSLASDAALRACMGAAAREASGRYGWDLAVREHLALYAQLSGSCAGGLA